MPKVSHVAGDNEHPMPTVPVPLTAEEFDKAFDEIADMVPADGPPLSGEAISRESIYTREDELGSGTVEVVYTFARLCTERVTALRFFDFSSKTKLAGVIKKALSKFWFFRTAFDCDAVRELDPVLHEFAAFARVIDLHPLIC